MNKTLLGRIEIALGTLLPLVSLWLIIGTFLTRSGYTYTMRITATGFSLLPFSLLLIQSGQLILSKKPHRLSMKIAALLSIAYNMTSFASLCFPETTARLYDGSLIALPLVSFCSMV